MMLTAGSMAMVAPYLPGANEDMRGSGKSDGDGVTSIADALGAGAFSSQFGVNLRCCDMYFRFKIIYKIYEKPHFQG